MSASGTEADADVEGLLLAVTRLSPADSEAVRVGLALRLAAAAPVLLNRLRAAETGALANRGSAGSLMTSVVKAMADRTDDLAQAKARGRAEALEQAAQACRDLSSPDECAEAIRSLPGWAPQAVEVPF